MEKVFVRRDVIDPAALKALCVRSNTRGAVQLASHLTAVALSGTLLWVMWGTWWAFPIFAVHGILVNFLYAGQHELSHWTVFRTAWVNEWVGRCFGFVLFYPRTFDQVQHSAHHRHTQHWERDGELSRERYTLTSYLWWMSGVTYWYTRWRRILRFCAGVITEPYLPPTRHAELIREARFHLAGYSVIAFVSIVERSSALLILWLAPMLTMKCVHQLQNTIEHLGLPHESNILFNTRSTRTNGVMRWLGWQMQFHTAHHAFPGVPFHRLRKLHHAIFTARDNAPPSMTYLGFQAAVLRAFAQGRSEMDYSDHVAWIADQPRG